MPAAPTIIRLSLAGAACLLSSVILGVSGLSPVAYAQPKDVTFNRDVAPIIYDNCTTCHRAGEAAPFPLVTYADVKSRSRLIVEATKSHYMPPWQPESGEGEFAHDRRLSNHDIATLEQWVTSGQVEGSPSDLPPTPSFSREWRLGKPSLIVQATEPFAVPADGRDVFRNFVIPVPIGERRFVKAIEFRAGNPKAVHHARILLDDTGEVRKLDEREPGPGFGGMDVPGARFPDGHFLGWAPGKVPDLETYPWSLEPGTDLVVQLHLKPTGREEEVQPSIAFYFTDQAPTATPIMIRLGVKTIDMEAGNPRYEISDSYTLPVDVTVNSIYPHAHYLAKEMRVTSRRSDGSTETLLSIPNWNFNWQDEYIYRRPLTLRKGTVIQMRYTYDNSAGNPHNPSAPPKRVRFGAETTDEMGELLLQVVPKNASDVNKLRADVTRKNLLTDIDGEEKLLRDHPDDVEARNAMGVAYAALGRGTDAARAFQEVVRTNPDHAMANYNLGVIAMAEKRLDEAERLYRRALAVRPDYGEAHNNLGVLLEATGRGNEALEHYRAAIKARPMNPASRSNMGRVLLTRGDVPGAIAELQVALKTRPDHPDALYNLGRAQLAQGHPRDAADSWQRALVARPEGIGILVDLAWLLATNAEVQRPVDAVRFAERANSATGNSNAAVLDVLAAAYAADGRMDRAAATARRGFQRALATGDERLAADIRRRMDGYQQMTGAADSSGIQ